MVQTIKPQVCPVCERPAIGGATHPRCKTRYSLDGLISFFVYDGPVKQAIKDLKYRFVTDLADELISFIDWRAEVGTKILCGTKNIPFRSWQNFVPSRTPNFSNYIITPVPLHPSRLRWRGFNQSEMLGGLIADKLKINFVPNLLVRKKSSRPQVELRGKARKENIVNAFSVTPNIPISQYPDVVLFDDVWTTGATLRTCGAVLKKAGAKWVWGLTLAR
jgi:ComF family protein